MKFNRILIISLILISLFAIGAVSASDNNGNDAVEITDVEVNQDSNDVMSDIEVNNAKINVDVDDTELGSKIEVNVSISDVGDDFNYNEVRYNVSFDGNKINSEACVLDADGKGQVTIDPHGMSVGRYYIEATLFNVTDGSIIVKGGNSFNITANNYIINVENVESNVYDIVTIPVTVTNSKGEKTGVYGLAIVTINWGGDSLSQLISIENGEGKATFNFTDIIGIFTSMDFASMMGDSGAMDWGAMFSEAGFNTSTMNWTSFNWSSMASMFSGDGMNWSAMFSGEGGMTDALGSMMAVTFDYIFTPGNYDVTTTFLPSRNNNAANTTSNLTILYLEDVVYLTEVALPKKHGDNTTVTLTVVDKRSIPIANITVSVVLDGRKLGDVELDENATAKFVLEAIDNGVHKLEFTSVIDGNAYNGSTEFEVNLPNADTNITAKDTSISAVNTAIDGKVGSYLSVTLKDTSGNVLTNKKVQFTIATKKYTATTDSNGVAKVQLNIPKADVYTCSICFLGDEIYNSAFEMVKVTVKKQSVKLTPAKTTYKFKANTKTKTVKVTLKNAKGKAIKGKQITLKIKNKTFKAKTNAKGVATIKVNFTKKGKYTVKTSFAGDATYNAISKNIKLILS